MEEFGQMKVGVLLTMAHTQTTSLEEAAGFRLAIRIAHPELLPEEITQQLGRMPDVAHAVGGPRRTPKGTPLPGAYAESYWLLRGPASDDLRALLEWANATAGNAAPFIRKVVSTGGRLEYFIGCFVEGQLGASLDPQLLSECASLGATLVFDIYGASESPA
jgi:hypothetical protein